MRRAIGRRNANDPNSSPEILISYINDFVSLIMGSDVKLFDNYGTLSFTIDETTDTGVYTFNDVGADHRFTNISMEAFISFLEPENNSTSWNQLWIYQDPGEFYSIWGINNEEILVRGYPTMMLYYGTEFVFRTLPERPYLINIYGYKIIEDFSSEGDPELPQDYYLRYIAYGAALNYARDFRFDDSDIAKIQRTFQSERKQLMTRTHNQVKMNRAYPRF
jgi:hypothetical protein